MKDRHPGEPVFFMSNCTPFIKQKANPEKKLIICARRRQFHTADERSPPG